MKHNRFILILIFCSIILSCEKEKELLVENNDIQLLINEVYSDELRFEYTYNEANLLKERKTKWFYTCYSYNDENQLISYDFYEDPGIYSSTWEIAEAAMNRVDWVTPENTTISGRGTYSYSNGKLKKIEVSRFPGGTITFVTFDHYNNGRIWKETHYYNNLPSGFIEYTYDETGNLILATHKDITDGNAIISITEEYEFDDKKNPYKAFKRLLLPGEYTNENNIVKRTMTLFFDVTGVDKVQVTEATYEYDLLDYPVKKNNTVRYEYR